MPPQLAAFFTTGQAAVLAIVAAEAGPHGACERSLDELAARAGVCRSIAKRALREAVRRGLVAVEVRPREGRRHDTNKVRITSASWRAWLLRSGGKKAPTTGKILNSRKNFGDNLSTDEPCQRHEPQPNCRPALNQRCLNHAHNPREVVAI